MPEFLQGMNAPAWSALISTAALIVTIIFFIIGWSKDRFSRGLDAIRWMDERFQGSEFRELRQRAATHLIKKPDTDPPGREAVHEVLNFFETLAFLRAKRIADVYSIWHFFGSWLIAYYSASQYIVAPRREKRPSLWRDLEALYKEICEIEKSQHPSKTSCPCFSTAAIAEFLKGEAALTT